jgi:hypothetical protein
LKHHESSNWQRLRGNVAVRIPQQRSVEKKRGRIPLLVNVYTGSLATVGWTARVVCAGESPSAVAALANKQRNRQWIVYQITCFYE